VSVKPLLLTRGDTDRWNALRARAHLDNAPAQRPAEL